MAAGKGTHHDTGGRVTQWPPCLPRPLPLSLPPLVYLQPDVQILDIGGKPVIPSFSTEPEVPPIPCHVHNGNVIVRDTVYHLA